MNATQDQAELLDAARVQPLPQLVLGLDRHGRVLDFEDALIGGRFAAASPRRGWSAHRCLHPDCQDAECRLAATIRGALDEVDGRRIIEWELPDVPAGLTARLHMRRARGTTEVWATLTIVDITEGRRESGSLREANRALTELIDRNENVRVRQVQRLDRKLRNLSAELIIAQENERRRIAADLHDGLGQWLSMAKLCLEAGMHRVSDDVANAELGKAFSHLRRAIGEVRSIARNLRPSMLEEFGLIPTLELLCHELQLSRPRLQVDCQVEGEPRALSQAQCVAMVRVLQEALNNAAKHSNATRLTVLARFQPNQSLLRVRDNGRGIALGPDGKLRLPGIGVTSMRERTVQSGGRFRLASSQGIGTQVSASWRHDTHPPELDLESGTYKTISDSVGGDSSGAAQV